MFSIPLKKFVSIAHQLKFAMLIPPRKELTLPQRTLFTTIHTKNTNKSQLIDFVFFVPVAVKSYGG